MLALVIVLLIPLAWAVLAGRVARWSVTAPLAMVAAGAAFTAGPTPLFTLDLDTGAVEHLVEVVLAVLLFVDATEVPGGVLGHHPRWTLRLVLLALPLSLVLAVLAGLVTLPGYGVWVLAVAATAVVPTDLAPAAALLRDVRVPLRVRELLNVESGLNDGLVAPVFLFAVALADPTPGAHGSGALDALLTAGPAVLVAVGVGVVVGLFGGRTLAWAWARGWSQPSPLRVGVVALALLAYAAAIVLHGNGFVAAFVAGMAFRPSAGRLPHDAVDSAEDVSAVLSYGVWFVFGDLLVQSVGDAVVPRAVLFAVLALTVVRVVPVLLSLGGTSIDRVDRAVIGWMGPRGLASVVFGLLAHIDLSRRDGDLVSDVMVVTVTLSLVLHGLTARPLGALYARRAAGRQRAAEAGAPDPSRRPEG